MKFGLFASQEFYFDFCVENVLVKVLPLGLF